MTATCKYTAKDQPRVVPGEHYDECEGVVCEGCWPCPELHCASCGFRHAEVTCTDCLATARTDLAIIADLCGFPLLEEVLSRGVESEAAMLFGPAADVEAWRYRKMSAIMGRVDAAYLDDCRDENHPLWSLGWVENEWREAYDHRTDNRVTLAAAADYIGRMLHVVAAGGDLPDGTPAPEFSDAKARLAACRSHLENVLSEGMREEKGAPCPDCRNNGVKVPKVLVKVFATSDVTGASDRWTCKVCKAWWSEGDYRMRVGTDHIEYASELTSSDMVTRTRVDAATIRKWASRDRLKSSGKSHDGRLLYRVADVVALRDKEPAEVA